MAENHAKMSHSNIVVEEQMKKSNMQFLLGNEAIARGAYEAGVRVAAAYPGTPSSEIIFNIAKYDEIFSEWAVNEKVSAEVAMGASIAGARAMCSMKHVGLNVAADLLFTASYSGVNAGFVICVADDMGMHSSQNEQDSRHYARAAKVMMLEPSTSAECKDYLKRAFELSEDFDVPVLLRLCTRTCHSRGLVEIEDRKEVPLINYEKNSEKYVMAPANARPRHVAVEARQARIAQWANTTDLNQVEMHDKRIGVIAGGVAYQYAKEALGENASYLKLGVVYPLPDKLMADFVSKVDVCYVIEELDPFIEQHCRAIGLPVKGKECFPNSLTFEYSVAMLKKAILGIDTELYDFSSAPATPVRPPIMCAGCTHRGIFYVLKKLDLVISGDIGCYTLAAFPPLSAMDAQLDMGAGVSMAHGMEMGAGRDFARRTVGVIGDSTFVHSGITSLIDLVYNKGTSTIIILDNYTTGMTGQQHHPATGITIKGEKTHRLDLVKLCEAIGVRRVVPVDAFDLERFREVVEEELTIDEPSVIITQGPCRLLKEFKNKPPYTVNDDKCVSCAICVKIGCPALTMRDNAAGKRVAVINELACSGCGVCAGLCKFDAMHTKGEVGQ